MWHPPGGPQIKSDNRTGLLKVLPWTVFFEMSQPVKWTGLALMNTTEPVRRLRDVAGTEDGGLLCKRPSPQGLDLLLPQCSWEAGQVPQRSSLNE